MISSGGVGEKELTTIQGEAQKKCVISNCYLFQVDYSFFHFQEQHVKMASGSIVPFADPISYTRGVSAYYNESHWRLQRETREYVEKYISPNCETWEAQGSVPPEV